MPTDIDLSSPALERLLAMDAQRTPGECRNYGRDQFGDDGPVYGLTADESLFAVVYRDDSDEQAKKDADCIAAAVNHLAPLVREVLRLRAAEQRAQVVLDGCDYREGHLRDNADVDELRDVVRGLADQLHGLRTAVEQQLKWCPSCVGSGEIHDQYNVLPCPACAGLRAALRGEVGE